MKYVFVKDRIKHEACTMLVIILSDRVVGLKKLQIRVGFKDSMDICQIFIINNMIYTLNSHLPA